MYVLLLEVCCETWIGEVCYDLQNTE